MVTTSDNTYGVSLRLYQFNAMERLTSNQIRMNGLVPDPLVHRMNKITRFPCCMGQHHLMLSFCANQTILEYCKVFQPLSSMVNNTFILQNSTFRWAYIFLLFDATNENPETFRPLTYAFNMFDLDNKLSLQFPVHWQRPEINLYQNESIKSMIHQSIYISSWEPSTFFQMLNGTNVNNSLTQSNRSVILKGYYTLWDPYGKKVPGPFYPKTNFIRSLCRGPKQTHNQPTVYLSMDNQCETVDWFHDVGTGFVGPKRTYLFGRKRVITFSSVIFEQPNQTTPVSFQVISFADFFVNEQPPTRLTTHSKDSSGDGSHSHLINPTQSSNYYQQFFVYLHFLTTLIYFLSSVNKSMLITIVSGLFSIFMFIIVCLICCFLVCKTTTSAVPINNNEQKKMCVKIDGNEVRENKPNVLKKDVSNKSNKSKKGSLKSRISKKKSGKRQSFGTNSLKTLLTERKKKKKKKKKNNLDKKSNLTKIGNSNIAEEQQKSKSVGGTLKSKFQNKDKSGKSSKKSRTNKVKKDKMSSKKRWQMMTSRHHIKFLIIFLRSVDTNRKN
ncbi:hypothetical protein RDWZM_007659 [Blomia tropicalis]|uniref:Uncharacterized protein n=1 Tax=Blomia tropicalis TaxID=40697 RepID=A0A9Q0M0A1_BLOTA|nr:hypothetical protein RDWZM_007659 [Blomia tropicalis]